jgi:hypothetical protein
MTLSRAQEALARPGEHITALRELFGRFLTQEHFFRTIAEEITDMDICYQMGNDRSDRHPLVGRWGPNLTLHAERGTTCIAELMCTGRGLLVDLAGRSALRSGEGDKESDISLGAALKKWFGTAR